MHRWNLVHRNLHLPSYRKKILEVNMRVALHAGMVACVSSGRLELSDAAGMCDDEPKAMSILFFVNAVGGMVDASILARRYRRRLGRLVGMATGMGVLLAVVGCGGAQKRDASKEAIRLASSSRAAADDDALAKTRDEDAKRIRDLETELALVRGAKAAQASGEGDFSTTVIGRRDDDARPSSGGMSGGAEGGDAEWDASWTEDRGEGKPVLLRDHGSGLAAGGIERGDMSSSSAGEWQGSGAGWGNTGTDDQERAWGDAARLPRGGVAARGGAHASAERHAAQTVRISHAGSASSLPGSGPATDPRASSSVAGHGAFGGDGAVAGSGADNVAQLRVAYMQGLDGMRRRAFGKAAALFGSVRAQAYDPHLRGLGAYWQGEALYAMRRYGEAARLFVSAHRSVRSTRYQAEALLKVGYCAMRLGKHAQAEAYFSDVQVRYPRSVAAVSAREALAGMQRRDRAEKVRSR